MHATKLEKDATQNYLPFGERFVFGVVLPNIGLVVISIVYFYWAGYFAEFSKIAGPTGPGPGAGTGSTLLAAIVVFLVGFAFVVFFLLIPSLVVTFLVSTRKWSVRWAVFLAGSASCTLVAGLYYVSTFLFLNSIRV